MMAFTNCNFYESERFDKEKQLREALQKLETPREGFDEAHYFLEPRQKKSETVKKEEKIEQKGLKEKTQRKTQQKSEMLHDLAERREK